MRKLNTVLELLFLILETTIFPPSMRIGYTFSGLREEIQEEFQDHVLRQEKTLRQLDPAARSMCCEVLDRVHFSPEQYTLVDRAWETLSIFFLFSKESKY